MNAALKRACRLHLGKTFGLTAYRPGQKAAVHGLIAGRDVLCILPTGAGKSLCWQLPAVVHKGLTVVVSPLIALMRDQVQHLQQLGIPALMLDSLMTADERMHVMSEIRSGRARILFVSPERLQQTGFISLCRDRPPWLVVVDEAHCVVQWGQGFRPAYEQIPVFLHKLPKRPVLCALTATADRDMQQEILRLLDMQHPKRVILPDARENLIYQVQTTLDRTQTLQRLIHGQRVKTVIFCRSRKRAEALAHMLQEQGIPAAAYHAGLAREERLAIQECFRLAEVEVLCATTAFGMGVDIPDIRRVIHDDLPDSVIDYIQQSGRCGRDGAEAACILLLEPNALIRKTAINSRAREKYPKRPLRRYFYVRKYWQDVSRLLRIVIGGQCIPAGLVRSLGGSVNPCGKCTACRNSSRRMSVPDLRRYSVAQIRTWLLDWQRRAYAHKTGQRPGQVLPSSALYAAGRRLIFPANVHVPEEMERLLAHLRRDAAE